MPKRLSVYCANQLCLSTIDRPVSAFGSKDIRNNNDSVDRREFVLAPVLGMRVLTTSYLDTPSPGFEGRTKPCLRLEVLISLPMLNNAKLRPMLWRGVWFEQVGDRQLARVDRLEAQG